MLSHRSPEGRFERRATELMRVVERHDDGPRLELANLFERAGDCSVDTGMAARRVDVGDSTFNPHVGTGVWIEPSRLPLTGGEPAFRELRGESGARHRIGRRALRGFGTAHLGLVGVP